MSDHRIIQACDVVKVYDGGKVRALDGVDLVVEEAELVAITGPSGCGKSTLLHLLAALDVPTSGSITVHGHDLCHLRHADSFRRYDVGLIFQLHNLLPRLTVLENVEIAMFGSHRSRAQERFRARALLEELDLAHLEARRPPQLSGGERQRVAIARALANEPPVLLADEPTGSLDSAAVSTVLGIFRRLQSAHGVTVLLVTHDQEVAAVADRLVHMLDGRVVEP